MKVIGIGRVAVFVLALAAAGGLWLSLAGAVLANPPEPSPASCQGYEASFFGGFQEEGGLVGNPGLISWIRDNLEVLGVETAGHEIKRWAQAKEESHEACDAALV